MKWSGESVQSAKVYPTLKNGYSYNVPSDFSNFDMYSSAVRVFNNPSASNANTLFFLQNGQLRQFDRSVVDSLTGAN